MNHTFDTVGFSEIRHQLADYTNTAQAKELALSLTPYLSETELQRHLRETSQARRCLEELGTPPLPHMENIAEQIEAAVRGEMLTAEEIETVGMFLRACSRMKSYLKSGMEKKIALAFYSENLSEQNELDEQIAQSIRNGRVDDYASPYLKDIRRNLDLKQQELKDRAERLLRTNKAFLADSFVVTRNGRTCLPIKKDCRGKVPGSVIDTSASKATLFIEPAALSGIREELDLLQIEEDSEVRRILYLLSDAIASCADALTENIRTLVKLDFVFAKGKMSFDMNAVEPEMNADRYIRLRNARHPLLPRETCVPLNFSIGGEKRGVIITGPNTGGKTVAIKTVALLSLMACSGLHVPCAQAQLTMNSQVLCDIGDGQNISDNLSTFSAHITNVISILRRVNRESLVILDELGSGTDPAEGMGIAIAILEELRKSGCLFLATTHYPEVKEYADSHEEIENARMAFDRESLVPLYRLEIGKAGESCALYIAKKLGIPNEMLKTAARAAYGSISPQLSAELDLNAPAQHLTKESAPRIERRQTSTPTLQRQPQFSRGDSVTVFPDEKIGIVVKPADDKGNVLVQIQKEKMLVNQKRLKLKVAASELYPEDYDFSILFDTVENRKARHQMSKRHRPDLVIEVEG